MAIETDRGTPCTTGHPQNVRRKRSRKKQRARFPWARLGLISRGATALT